MAYIDDVYSVVQIQPTGIEAFVRLSQNENGRRLYFAITGGEIPTGSTATLSGTKPDGVVYSKTGTISGNVVTILEDVQLTAAAGPWPAKLRILNGGNVVATGRIRFVIDKDPVAAGAVPSDSQLEGLVAEAAAYAEAAKDGAYYGSPLTASTVAGMTDKNRVYVYTGSESGYTAGNWYYWNGSAWTSGGVYNSQGIQTDKTLSVTGMAADAKAVGDALKEVKLETDKTLTQADVPADAKVVGDEIADLKADLEKKSGLTEEAKVALLTCFANVAWINDQGQTYYDNLEAALYDDYPKITATFAPGSNIIYTDDDPDTLKQYLTVKYYTSKTDTGTTIPAASYTLSGVLRDGENVVRVTYLDDYKTMFIVNAVDFYNQHTFSYPSSELETRIGNSAIDKTTQALSTNSNIKYRCILTAKKGITPYYDTVEQKYINVYPFPVPSDATSITVSYDVGVVWGAVNVFEHNGNNYSLLQDLGAFGNEGGNTKALPSGENRFVTLVFGSRNNVTFEGTDWPQSVTITFN